MSHIDSISESGEARTVAPGADDDGSGVVAAMEAGRVIARYARGRLTRSVDVALFNDEEEGMGGSQTYAASVKGRMAGFVNLDMIGNGAPPRSSPVTTTKPATNRSLERSPPPARRTASRGSACRRPATGTTTKMLRASGPRTFPWPTCRYEEEMSPHWHEITDTVENVNVDQIELTTKAVVGAIVDLAR